MHRVVSLRSLSLLLWTSVLLGSAACGASMRYGTGSVEPRAWGSPNPKIVVPEIVDGRTPGAIATGCIAMINTDHDEELLELREAVHEHTVEAGLVSEGTVPPRAPTSDADAEKIIADAVNANAEAVVFLRLQRAGAYGVAAIWAQILVNIGAYLGALPLVVIFASIPVHEEHAWASVEAIVLEPSSRALLLRTEQAAALDDDGVTGWGFDADQEIRDQIKIAVDKVLDDVAKARAAGWPARGTLENGAHVVVFGDPVPAAAPVTAPAGPAAAGSPGV